MGLFDWIFGKKKQEHKPANTEEEKIHRNIQHIGLHYFPDDEDAKWNIDSIKFENGMYIVETSPVPHVGYEKIRFYMRDSSINGVVSADSWDNGEWSGLFS